MDAANTFVHESNTSCTICMFRSIQLCQLCGLYLVIKRQRAFEGHILSANAGHHTQALWSHPSSRCFGVQLELLNSLKCHSEFRTWVHVCQHRATGVGRNAGTW